MPQTLGTSKGLHVSAAWNLLGIAHLMGGKEKKLLSQVLLGYRISH